MHFCVTSAPISVPHLKWNRESHFTDTVIDFGGILFCRFSSTFWNSCCQGKQINEGYLIFKLHEQVRESCLWEKWGRREVCEVCWEQRSFSVSKFLYSVSMHTWHQTWLCIYLIWCLMENLANVCEEKIKDQNAEIKALGKRIPAVDLDSSSRVTSLLTFLSNEI